MSSSGTQASKVTTTISRLRDHVVQWFKRDSNAFPSYYSVVLSLCSCLCFFCMLLLCCVLLCVITHSLTLILIVTMLCRAWETPTCGDLSQTESRYKEEYSDTQVWSLDHLRGVECNPWPEEVTTRSRLWPNHGKFVVCLVHFTLLRFMSSLKHL
jgi:hypothetical protein